MSTNSAASRRKCDIDTPALLFDLDALDRNTITMAGVCRANGKSEGPACRYEDATVNLHDLLFGLPGDIVEIAWPIAAQGKIN